LPTPGGPRQDDIRRLGDEGQPRQFADLPFVEGGLEGEVELVEGAGKGKVRHVGAGPQVALPPGRDLDFQHFRKDLSVGQVVVGRLVQLVGEDRGGVRQLQLFEVGVGLGQGQHHRPSPIRAP
jgi:hypothetical protein